MNFITLLYRLGIDPASFKNQMVEPIKTDDGFIWEVSQIPKDRTCPICGSVHNHIHGYYHVEINCSSNEHIRDVLRIRKVRLKCKDCGKVFTMPISGIEAFSTMSTQTKESIRKDFFKKLSFSDIAIRYDISTARAIQIFDETFKFVPRRSLPFALCIDEIKFTDKMNRQKYCCVLYDHEGRDIVDMIKNRQLAYLFEYFDAISEKERRHVKIFVSDMYDTYKTICKRYFPKALHIIDLFHVIKLLDEAIKKIRIRVMNTQEKTSPEYRFMKRHWKLFLCRKDRIPDKWYTPKDQDPIHYSDMIFRCQCLDSDLLEASNIMYDLYRYQNYDTFFDALRFVTYIADRLLLAKDPALISVGNSYHKWKVEIANGLVKNKNDMHYSNGIAEAINNKIKTIVKISYGYQNFERFRKRVMLIYTYKNRA